MPAKGFERRVRAFAAVAPEIAGWRLRICGAGDEFLGGRGERLLLVPMASGRIAVKP